MRTGLGVHPGTGCDRPTGSTQPGGTLVLDFVPRATKVHPDEALLLSALTETLLRSPGAPCTPETLHILWHRGPSFEIGDSRIVNQQIMSALLRALSDHRSRPACRLRSLLWDTEERDAVAGDAMRQCLHSGGGSGWRDVDIRCRVDAGCVGWLPLLWRHVGRRLTLRLDCTTLQREFNHHVCMAFLACTAAAHASSSVRRLALTLQQYGNVHLTANALVTVVDAVTAAASLRRVELRLTGIPIVLSGSPHHARPTQVCPSLSRVVLDVTRTGIDGEALCVVLARLLAGAPNVRWLTVAAEDNPISVTAAFGTRFGDALGAARPTTVLRLSEYRKAMHVRPETLPDNVRIHWTASSVTQFLAQIGNDDDTTAFVWSTA